jgi:type I restriction enzyme, S subunit
MKQRYSTYKSSGVEWIGEIPSHWNFGPMKYVLSNNDGGVWGDDVENEGEGTMVIRSTEITIGGKWDFSNPMWRLLSETEKSKCKLFKGDIVITKSSGSPDHIGKSVIVDDYVESLGCCYSNFVQRIRFKEFSPRLYHYILNSGVVREQFRYLTQTTTGLGNLSGTTLNEVFLPFIPLPEQEQIVKYLDEKTSQVDGLISITEKKIELLKQKRTSLINELVTKGLNKDVELKNSGVEWIGEIPKHWVVIKLHFLVTSQMLEFQDGNHGSEHPNPDEFIKDGVPFIKPKDIQNETILWDECDRLPFERCQSFRIGFSNNGDVLLVNRGGSIGKVVYVSDFNNEYPYFVINPQVTYLRGKNGLDSKYLFYTSLSNVFKCGVELVLGHGSTFPFLGLSNMGDFEMVIPPLPEQEQIVKYLDTQTTEIDKLVSIEKRRIETLKEYRQSLISEVVTGKIKVTNN